MRIKLIVIKFLLNMVVLHKEGIFFLVQIRTNNKMIIVNNNLQFQK